MNAPDQIRNRGAEPSWTSLHYRYGFCAMAPGAMRPEQATELDRLRWSLRRIGPVELWTHPDAPLRVMPAGEATYVFVGDVFVEDPSGAEPDPILAARVATLAPHDDAALLALLATLAGRFALLLIEGDRVQVFHDAMGARTVFYHAVRPFAVASHATLLAEALGAEGCPAVAAHCAHPEFPSRKTSSLPGDRTLFCDIHALIPNNAFDSASMRTRRYWPRAPRQETSLAEFHDRLDGAMKALGTFTRGRYTPILGLTGGVDTRVVIAALRNQGVPFETMTWLRAKLSVEERDIIDALEASLGVPHHHADAMPQARRIREICARNTHALRLAAANPVAAWGPFAGRPDTIFLRGHGAEVMRGFFNLWSSQMRALTPPEMSRMYFSPSGAPPPPDTVGFFEGYFDRGNYAGVAALGYDPNDIFYWEHRMGMWGSLVHNGFDVAMRSIPAYNSRQLFEAALSLPPERRLTKRLLLDATARYDPALAEAPLARMVEAPIARKAAARDAAAKAKAASRRAPAGARQGMTALAASESQAAAASLAAAAAREVKAARLARTQSRRRLRPKRPVAGSTQAAAKPTPTKTPKLARPIGLIARARRFVRRFLARARGKPDP